LIVLSFATYVQAKDTIDPSQVSLLTCSPGSEIYNLFGHTAIRYQNKTQGIDVVFNYGMFSFRKPHFILRFSLGQTDYELGVEDYSSFVEEYELENRSVEEQVLNLNPTEKKHLYEMLQTNYLPENRTYRYNFFYDNCSTRPRNKIEENVDGRIVYMPYNKKKSYRDIIHEYTIGHPWARFGIDLCLGAKADRPINQRGMMFCPFYLRNFIETATIKSRRGVRPLLIKHNQLVISQSTKKEAYFPTPFQCSVFLFIIVTAATIYGLKNKRSLWILDLILYAAAGLAGCVLAFLMLFSTHPTVESNFLIFVLHPFYLFCLPWILISERTHRKSKPMIFFCIILTLFIVLWGLIPQKIDLAIVPLALSLLTRSTSHMILTHEKKK
jgi:hypothetical protein